MCFILLLSPVFFNEKFCLRLRLETTFAIAFFFFFFSRVCETCGYCSCTVQWTVAAKFNFSIFFSQSVHIVHYSWTHKFHFSATFSLKSGPTVLFTYLKIILLQYFSVFSFSFQFSAVSKQILSVVCIPVNQIVKKKNSFPIS